MQFTPQQLAGAQRYGSKTRVGNWLEDKCLEETKLSEFRRAQFGGTLLMNDLRAKDAVYNKSVNLSKTADGYIRFGDVVMVASMSTKTALAVDLTESLFESDTGSRLVTAVPQARSLNPVARTAFKVVNVDESDREPRPLRFGEPFRLACSDHLLIDADQGVVLPSFYLASTLKNERNGSRVANQQPVFMTQSLDTNSVWTCEKIPDADAKCGIVRQLACEEFVPACDRYAAADMQLSGSSRGGVVIQHRATKQSLSTNSKFVDCTDFGRELEVTCHNYFGTRKVEALASEMAGYTTGATNARLEQPGNWFVLSTAAAGDASDEAKEDVLPPKQSASTVLDAAKRALHAIPDAQLKLDALARECPGAVLDREDLAHELREIGLQFDPFFTKTLLDAFDDHHDGMIHVGRFVDAMFE